MRLIERIPNEKNFALTSVSLLVACSAPENARPVDVKYSSKSARTVRGFHPTLVRTYLSEDGSRKEITGVPCSLHGSGFHAKFQSPAAVNVPTYGLASRSILVECKLDGVSKELTQVPVNVTEQKAVAIGANAGIIGLAVAAGAVAARSNKNTDEYGYNPVILNFKR